MIEASRSVAYRLDLLALKGIAAVVPAAGVLVEEHQSSALDDEKEWDDDLRNVLVGFWLTVGAIAAGAFASLAPEGFGAHSLAAAVLVGVPLTLTTIHGVYEAISRRRPVGSRQFRPGRSNATFWATWAVEGSFIALVLS